MPVFSVPCTEAIPIKKMYLEYIQMTTLQITNKSGFKTGKKNMEEKVINF